MMAQVEITPALLAYWLAVPVETISQLIRMDELLVLLHQHPPGWQ